MTSPAEVTSAADWDRLTYALRAIYQNVDDLYQRIVDDRDAERKEAERQEAEQESSVSDPEIRDSDDMDAAEREEQERLQLDEETDRAVDDDPASEPDLEP